MTIMQRATSMDGGLTGAIRVVPTAAELYPDRHAKSRRRQAIMLGVATPVVFLALWEVGAQLGWIDSRYFPAPSTILAAAVEVWNSGQLQSDFVATIVPLLIGLLIGFAAGCVVGFAMGLVRPLRLAFDPMLSALYTIPKLALLPLLLLIFGIGVVPKIILIALGVFFITWITVLEAVTSIPTGYRETAKSFGVGPVRTFRRVLFPAVLPEIFVGLRIAVGNAVLIAIGIEFVNGNSGIGYRIWNSWQLFVADRMYVGIVLVAVLGIILRLLVDLLRRICVPWETRADGRSN